MESGWPFLLGGIFWIFGFILFWKIPFLQSSPSPGDRVLSYPTVSVIIPARNEEKNLESLLRSLSRQSSPPHEILVVDDHSDDRTAEIAVAYGAGLLSLPELPAGWVGKGWACWMGAKSARGDLLVFLDADTILETDGLSRLLLEYRKKGGLLSAQPYHTMKKAYERLSAFFNIVLFLNMNIAAIFSSRSKPLGAFGPCVVCSREDYFSVGGHESVKGQILEDIALGKRFMDRGLPVRSFGGKGVISFRMYPNGLAQLVEGWTKNFASGAVSSHWLLVVLSSAWITGCLSAAMNIARGIAWRNESFLIGGGVLYVFFAFQIHFLLAQLGNFGLATALLYPLPLVFFILIFLRSVFFTAVFGFVTWKGRKIHLRRKGDRS